MHMHWRKMGRRESFSNSWCKAHENHILNPARNRPSLCGAYDIVIPTDSSCFNDNGSFVLTKTQRNNRNPGTTESSTSRMNRLGRRASKCWPCRENVSTSPPSSDSLPRKLDLRRPRLPVISNDAKRNPSNGTPTLSVQTQMPMSKVSLPNPSASTRRDLLGIHLTPQEPRVSEQATVADFSERDTKRTRSLPKRVYIRPPKDIRIQQEENLSPRADDRSVTSLEPDIRTSGCMLHLKDNQLTREKMLMYSTNSHGSVYTQYQRRNPSVVKKSVFEDVKKQYFDNEKMEGSCSLPRTLPVLPRDLPTDEFVVRWLVHGSAPPGESHFPDITS